MNDTDNILSYLCPECRKTVLIMHMREDVSTLVAMVQTVIDKEDQILAEGSTQKTIDELTQQILANKERLAQEQKK